LISCQTLQKTLKEHYRPPGEMESNQIDPEAIYTSEGGNAET
jgi:hypothetical protein